jgi:hypothetical protein
MLLRSNEFDAMVTWYVLCIWNHVCMSLAGIYQLYQISNRGKIRTEFFLF